MKQSWKRKFFTISAGQAASLIGSSAVQFALIWWIASETKSPLMMGFAGMAAFVPAAILSPVAGIVADRYNRKYICIAADLFIGIAAAVFALLLWRFEMPIWTALLILLVRSIGNVFHQPSLQALIPQFVPAEELVKAGGWNSLFTSGSFILGPALGAVLYAAFPLPVVLLTDLLGAVVASLMLAVVEIPSVPRQQREKKNVWGELKEGVQVFKTNRELVFLIGTEAFCMLFYMPLSSFYPLMTSDYFGASAWHGSAVEVLYALGMIVSAFLFANVIKVKHHIRISYIGLLGIGIVSGLCGILPASMAAWAFFAVLCGIMGAFGNVHNIPLVAYMQSSIPAKKLWA